MRPSVPRSPAFPSVPGNACRDRSPFPLPRGTGRERTKNTQNRDGTVPRQKGSTVTDHNPDRYAQWRHLEGKPVTVSSHELTEDVDGNPLGVERTEHTGTLILPSLPEQED